MTDSEMNQAVNELNRCVNEAARCMNSENDYFSVRCGAFSIIFDLTNLGKTKTEGSGGKCSAAAMRDALLIVKRLFDGRIMFQPAIRKAHKAVDAALSAPPRNCDRFADELDAQLAFLNEVWLISVDRATMLERDKYENWSDAMRARYGRWLLSHAPEKEGSAE